MPLADRVSRRYLGATAAKSDRLAYVNSAGQAIISMDHTSDLQSGALRNSVRITSTETIDVGTLVIADFTHVPYGCSTWPAFWAVGPNWPAGCVLPQGPATCGVRCSADIICGTQRRDRHCRGSSHVH